MELKDFVKTVLKDLVIAVDEASGESSRKMNLVWNQEKRTVEFDIAVSVEETSNATGKAGIKIFQAAELSGGKDLSQKNSTVSRIQLGVSIDGLTKEEVKASEAKKNLPVKKSERLNFTV